MTLTCLRESEIADPETRARLTRVFNDCAGSIRASTDAALTPSSAYAELVRRVAADRASEALLVLDGDRPVGRALVAVSRSMPGAATLGLFEVETDTTSDAIARLLVVSAGEWARRHGCTEILAPVDVNTWFSYRFVLPSGDARSEPAPYAWEPVQPAEYPALLGRLGFTEFERYATLGGRLPECEGTGAFDTTCATEDAFEHALDAGYRFVGLDATTDLGCLLDELHPLCMAAFRDNLLFEPLSKDHFRALFTGSIAASDCTLSQCVRDREGRLAGFALVLADRGTVAVKTIAIAPKHRGRRLSTALVHLVLRRATALGHRQFVAALVRRGNRSESLALPCLAAASDQWRREYVLLRCELETP